LICPCPLHARRVLSGSTPTGAGPPERRHPDLLTVAAEASPALPSAEDDASQLTDWIIALPPTEKDDLLVRVVQDQAAQVRMELLRRFRGAPDLADVDHPRRTVAALLDAAATR
jgi:hypothetical protein